MLEPIDEMSTRKQLPRLRDDSPPSSEDENKPLVQEYRPLLSQAYDLFLFSSFIIFIFIGKSFAQENDENARLMAGKRDVITRKKVKKQKRLLGDSLENLHKKLIAESLFQMSYATFCMLKPFWIWPASAVKRDTRLCILDENLTFIVEKLNFYSTTQQMKLPKESFVIKPG